MAPGPVCLVGHIQDWYAQYTANLDDPAEVDRELAASYWPIVSIRALHVITRYRLYSSYIVCSCS